MTEESYKFWLKISEDKDSDRLVKDCQIHLDYGMDLPTAMMADWQELINRFREVANV